MPKGRTWVNDGGLLHIPLDVESGNTSADAGLECCSLQSVLSGSTGIAVDDDIGKLLGLELQTVS
ncbi:hypothetical protein PISMIDRAFT_12977 [Pisolithus microcarpus 441]|uniref:Uncharacterized protein n=1 Tax=Pisolithus microcarpus 441 TaxID=765257 RepID=A0A0C9ZKS2_9AGAM|nr:hypothetical protein PISMIDRAFT_12977 [Pisolithus microcarpus 441]